MSLMPASSSPTDRPAAPSIEAPARTRSPRWHSLDVLKGVALWAMVAHHFSKWTGGDVDGRFLGYDHFIVTDLAAPVFAMGLGAAAIVVGARVDDVRGMTAPMRRWLEILLIGLAIDLVTHQGITGRGVLPTLAILGAIVTTAMAAGLRWPALWWAISAGCAFLAVPASEVRGTDVLGQLVHGPFALPVYGVFAGAGAAVACHALGREERSLPLARATVGVLVVGLAAYAAAGGALAPRGIWPPGRYPGHLGFTLWGLVASLGIWAVVRLVLPAGTLLGEAAARAGRRTLLVFAAHFVVKLGLQRADLIGDLDTWRWGLVTWAGVATVVILSSLPVRSRRST